MGSREILTVGIGDIHGRFDRVQSWLEQLEGALGRPADCVFAVGDVEAFSRADDHRRKAAKRAMPAEFSAYAAGEKKLHRLLHFIGGNNEDFAALHTLQAGGELAPGARYLGRVGTATLGGLRVAFLSGIFAPRYYEAPLAEPTTRDTLKQAGYFRRPEAEALAHQEDVDLMLVHEWPRGLFRPAAPGKPAPRPWMGNRITQGLVAALHPRWLLCGHSHLPWAATLDPAGPGGKARTTRVTCLDEAARPDGSIFWIEWEDRLPRRAGWGVNGAVAWEKGRSWGPDDVPARAG